MLQKKRGIYSKRRGRKKNGKLELESMMPMEEISGPKESRAI